LLEGAVTRLKRHAEEHEQPALRPTVFTILMEAQLMACNASLARFRLLSTRELRITPDHKTSAPLVKALKAREAYLRPFAQGTRPYKLIEELLALEQASPEPFPKLPEGRTANAAATWARQALAAANVPKGLPGFHQTLARLNCDKHAKNLHDALLMAVGLIRYGSSRHAAPR